MVVYDCSFCGKAASPKQDVILWSACEHRHHFECVRARLCEQKSLVCGLCDDASLQDFANDLKILLEEAQPRFRKEPWELEYHAIAELYNQRHTPQLYKIPEVVLAMEGLRCLDFTAQPIDVLPKEIEHLRSLERLVLNSLNLRFLPDELCELPELRQLLLCGNRLEALPERLSTMPRLWCLSMDANQLKRLPDSLPEGMDGLKISGNRLKSLPERLGDLGKLDNIQAYGNLLERLPDSICTCQYLRNVMIQGNRLAALPEAIGQLTYLESLLVHDNCLERLPDSVVNLKKLEWVYLYNNNLKELPIGFGEGFQGLSRLLIEANPLSTDSIQRLFTTPEVWRSRVFSADEDQVGRWCETFGKSPCDVPANCSVGRMLGWDRLYAKLTPASGLRGRSSQLSSAAKRDILVVAFSASQGEPEWLNVLGQLVGESAWSIEESRRKIDRTLGKNFEELYSSVHGGLPEDDNLGLQARKAMSALWYDFCNTNPDAVDSTNPKTPSDATRLPDFDVLSLCDTNAQWYQSTDVNDLQVEAKLRSFVKNYRAVMFLGVSMGGFGALSNAHLADLVAVFGLQTDLTKSHLRPGLGPEALAQATATMKASVYKALERGTRIEYHVAMEDHLLYASWLPLPETTLIIHPASVRVARFLERSGSLHPLLIDLIASLTGEVKPHPPSKKLCSEVSQEDFSTRLGWEWEDTTSRDKFAIAQWSPSGGFSLWQTTPKRLGTMLQETPSNGDWFCNSCCGFNKEKTWSCRSCSKCRAPPRRIASEPVRKKVHRCMSCLERHPKYAPRCTRCEGAMEFICGFCGAFGRTGDGEVEPVKEEWFCWDCWKKFEQHNRAMRDELPAAWFVEGGQVWEWLGPGPGLGTEPGQGGLKARLEFDRRGKLLCDIGSGWWVAGPPSGMSISFGKAPVQAYQLKRSKEGFDAYQDGVLKGSGKPLYGRPRSPLQAKILEVVEKLRAVFPESLVNAIFPRDHGRRGVRPMAASLLAFLALLLTALRVRRRSLT